MPLAQLETRDLLALAVIGALVLLFGVLLLSGRPSTRRALIPASMRPAPSDEELERRVLDRYLVWGTGLTLFMAILLPVLLVLEPGRMDDAGASFLQQDVMRGGEIYGAEGLQAVNCAQCHGPRGEGGVMPAIVDGEQVSVAVPPLVYIYDRYRAAGKTDVEISDLIRDAVERGRPGTIMPTWGLPFGGPLNAQQIESLLVFIDAIQEEAPSAAPGASGAEIFDVNCAICHGVEGTGRTADGHRTVAPNLEVVFDRLPPEEIRRVIEEGRVNVNRYSMPAWAHLGEQAVDALMAFLENVRRAA